MVLAYLAFVFASAPLLRGAIDRGTLTLYYVLGLLAAYVWLRRSPATGKWEPMDLAAAGLVLAGAISLGRSVFAAGTVEGVYLLGFYFLTYLLLTRAGGDRGRRQVAAWALAGGLLGAVLGLAGYWLSSQWLPFHRVAGTFEYPNAFAQHALYLYLGTAGAAAAGGPLAILGPAAAVLFGSWLLTLSRGSFYTFLPGVLVTAWLLGPGPRRRLVIFVAVTAVMGGLLATGVYLGQPALRWAADPGAARQVIEHLKTLRPADETAPPVPYAVVMAPGERPVALAPSVAGRLSLWQSAWRMIARRPWLGWGLGSFARVFPAYQADPEFFSVSAHNHYLQWWAETGLPGLGALAAVGVCVLLGLTRKRPWDGLGAGVAGGLVALALHLGLDVNWEIPAVALLFWGGLAFVRGDVPADPAVSPRPRSWILAPCVLLVALVAMPYLSGLAYERGRSELATGNLGEAMAGFRQAARLNPLDPLPLAFQAHCRHLAWRGSAMPRYLDDAVALSEQAVRRDPHNAALRNQLGRLLAERGMALGRRDDLERARCELERAVALFPGWAAFRYDLALLCREMGDEAAAWKVTELVLGEEAAFRRPIPPASREWADRLFAEIRLLAVEILLERDESDRAGELLDQALHLVPDHPWALELAERMGGEP